MTSYKDLIVWQKSFILVKDIYKVTKQFPADKLYGLVSQMRRCDVSIPSNIAEGYSPKHRQEYIQFIRITFGSGAELETQLLLVKDLGLASVREVENAYNLLQEIMKMLNKLLVSLTSSR